MSNRLNATYGVANLDTLLKLGESSVPRRIANEIYFIRVSSADPEIIRGRWAQYLPDSVLTVDESTVWYPRDSGGSDITNRGRWVLFTAGSTGGGSGDLTDGDKGDITVSSNGAVWTIDNGAVTAAKLAGTVDTDTITYAATVDLNMAALTGKYRTISLTGNLELTTSNRAAGQQVVLRLLADASIRTLTFPAGWRFMGTKPANIAASKGGILSLLFFGTADTDCFAAWGVEA